MSRQNNQVPATVAHVADHSRRYPGEGVNFFTRVEVEEPLSGLVLRVVIPEELELNGYQALSGDMGATPSIEVDGETRYVVWELTDLAPGGQGEFRAEATIDHIGQDTRIESRAVLTGGDHAVVAEETATVAVEAQGRYLRYLPEIYAQDDFMGRFLMLFESFWAPIESQIDNRHCYFDPDLTPESFLPWLASWVGMELDGRLPEERQRELLRSAVSLYRRRGTKDGLKDYLEAYTGGRAQVIEYRADNFRLGPEARLGPNIALGRENVPHTFSVVLHLPSPPPGKDPIRRREVESIIEAEKPAHTGYKLVIRREA